MATARDSHTGLEWRFRQMTLVDLVQVSALERASYAFPWSDQIFNDCLRVGYH